LVAAATVSDLVLPASDQDLIVFGGRLSRKSFSLTVNIGRQIDFSV
jgi:hypothetical protein